ncbi:hypothetical protein [Lachnoclostridium phytofermentans]|uniref:hypothetical protein n=1 Tax=Lachnoclostridium phytofermentans TaxID=66219 RepID=UPI0004981133|nr:hypothetical protein [Lachnoclostridium phytofermentans]
MKSKSKLVITLLILALCFFVYQYIDILIKYNKANVDVADLQSKISILNDANISLRGKISDHENGAENRLYMIRLAAERMDFNSVLSIADELHEKFPGSPEDLEGQELKNAVNAVLAEEAKAKEEAEKLAREEAEKAENIAREEAEKSAQEKAREIIRVTKLKVGKPNSAGGVDLFIGFTNNSDKIIKYIYFKATPYNAVGDSVKCDIKRESTTGVKDTGPYQKGEGILGDNSGYWQCVWYNYSIETVQLNEIKIEYMDGTSVTLTDKDLEYVQY